ncbi:MAG: hypothetical protein AB7N76_21695 [Planctomycetota bacterium]
MTARPLLPRARPAPLLGLLALALAAAPALADVVKLRNGAEIRGEVLRDDAEGVVVRTSGGKVSLPRKEVASVERESPGATLVVRARQALTQGRVTRAKVLLERAKGEKDAGAAREAGRLLEELERAPAPAPEVRPGQRGGPAAPKDPFDIPEEEALFRELEREAQTSKAARSELLGRLAARGRERYDQKQLKEAVGDARRARALAAQLSLPEATQNNLRDLENAARLVLARRALRQRDSALALAAAEPVAGAAKDLPRPYALAAHYLYGRALEASNRVREGEASYRRAIDRDLGASGHLMTYRELARLASVGVPIDEHSPGVGKGWSWIETNHFAILHQLSADAELGNRFEGWHAAVCERLGLRNKLPRDLERIPVFIYADEAGYRHSAGARAWTAGHAQRMASSFDDDDEARAVYFYPSPRFEEVARHEIAHVLVWDALGDPLLPCWASEGAALYAEPDASRAHRLQLAARYREHLKPAKDYLARMRLPATEDNKEIMLFYIQAGVSFAQIADALGVDRAFRVAEGINKDGPEASLRGVGWSLPGFEAAVDRELGSAR